MPSTSEGQQRYLVNRRQRARDYLGGSCARCGSTVDLEFDHIDPATKVIRIADAIAHHWAWAALVVELDKCQMLCGPHHKEKTSSEQGVPHGGGASGKKNCPCAPCKAQKAKYMAVYKRRPKPS